MNKIKANFQNISLVLSLWRCPPNDFGAGKNTYSKQRATQRNATQRHLNQQKLQTAEIHFEQLLAVYQIPDTKHQTPYQYQTTLWITYFIMSVTCALYSFSGLLFCVSLGGDESAFGYFVSVTFLWHIGTLDHFGRARHLYIIIYSSTSVTNVNVNVNVNVNTSSRHLI